MIAAFGIWSFCALLLLGIGVWAARSEKAVGFFAGVTPPAVKDVKKYNRAVALLWFVGAALFECLGIPLLFARRNAPVFAVVVPGTVLWAIGLMIAYSKVEKKHRA